MQWVRQHLVEAGEIDGSTRGVWKVTTKGLARLEDRPVAKRRETTGSEATLRDLVEQNRGQVRSRLKGEISQLSPQGFERFCRVLLQALGFDSVEVTRASADGGIDGFGDFRQGAVRIRSAFQAKRWAADRTVGRPEIDRFRGAIQGEFDHGVFLTTSRFSREAKETSIKRGAITILLLDGDAIADAMTQHGLGVRTEPVHLYELDNEFFDFEQSRPAWSCDLAGRRFHIPQHIVIRRPEWVAGSRERPEVGVFTQTHSTRPPVPWGRIAVGKPSG